MITCILWLLVFACGLLYIGGPPVASRCPPGFLFILLKGSDAGSGMGKLNAVKKLFHFRNELVGILKVNGVSAVCMVKASAQKSAGAFIHTQDDPVRGTDVNL
ncbi:MAG: hypothetical protein IJG15_06295 [Lachnospiraceae bacterium]|nr:hypothetical protein [Lachnospiraceae bacterium]